METMPIIILLCMTPPYSSVVYVDDGELTGGGLTSSAVRAADKCSGSRGFESHAEHTYISERRHSLATIPSCLYFVQN